MTNFAWIVPIEKIHSIADGGVSSSYIIPKEQMNGLENHLQNSNIWLFVRGSEDRCLAIINVKSVEKFEDGYYSGDFLVHSNLLTSLRLSISFETATPYSMYETTGLEIGINSLDLSIVENLKTKITNSIHTRFVAPSSSLLPSKDLISSFHDQARVRASISTIVQHLSLEQMWGAGQGYKLRPITNFALALIELDDHGVDASEVEFLRYNDPLKFLLFGESNSIDDRTVDLGFTLIDPNNIYARSFIHREGYIPDLESALNKTEIAEKLHQDMLRDISQYLLQIGVRPYESTSIDLMFVHNGLTFLYEIKSTTTSNFFAQAAKGAFQIAFYTNAMESEYQPLKSSLIVHKVADKNIEMSILSTLARLGVSCLVYDPDIAWPKRLKGFLNT